jgi:hypothetical protein
MNQPLHPARTRNVILFVIAAASADWIGIAANRLLGTTGPIQNLGLLIFLVLPGLTGLLLRAFVGDGWVSVQRPADVQVDTG